MLRCAQAWIAIGQPRVWLALMAETDPKEIFERVRLRGGFSEADRQWVADDLAVLARRLARWPPEQVEVEVGVKDRGALQKQVTVEVHVPGWPPLVGHGVDADVDRALREARNEVIGQIDEEKTRPAEGRTPFSFGEALEAVKPEATQAGGGGYRGSLDRATEDFASDQEERRDRLAAGGREPGEDS
jgi:hypothetical protein